MTILYNSEKHLFLLFSTKGTVWPSVLPFCILSVIITAAGYVAHEHFPYKFDITFPKENGFEVMTILLSFLVVARVQRTYNRMWDARHKIGECFQEARDLAVLCATLHAAHDGEVDEEGTREWHRKLDCYLCEMIDGMILVLNDEKIYQGNQKRETKVSFERNTVKETSGSEEEKIDYENNIGRSGSITNFTYCELPVDPFELTNRVHVLINNHKDYMGRKMEVQREMELHRQLASFVKNYHDLLKFASTPVPFPTTQMSQTILLVWVVLLPSVLLYQDCDEANDDSSTVPSNNTGTSEACTMDNKEISFERAIILGVVGFLGTFGFWGLERVAEELDLPFGNDDNDIDIRVLGEKTKIDISAHLNLEYDRTRTIYKDQIPDLVPLPSSLKN